MTAPAAASDAQTDTCPYWCIEQPHSAAELLEGAVHLSTCEGISLPAFNGKGCAEVLFNLGSTTADDGSPSTPFIAVELTGSLLAHLRDRDAVDELVWGFERVAEALITWRSALPGDD
ncbi:DUF6907 domain-containing protein [Kitasatospora sp. NPDC050543]|uniref:DUF6907 domain-containing protein n=1 Tax=Kitasatospora sp. NPDC050543 TaxID=3364054 RepID=UPI0037B1D974